MSNLTIENKSGILKSFAYRKSLIAGSIALLLVSWAAAQSTGGIYGFMGAPALSISNLSPNGGTLFEVRFDPINFAGDLIARQLGDDGSFTPDVIESDGSITVTAWWQAKSTTTAQSLRQGGSATDDRIIFTSDGSGGRRFWWDNSADDALTDDMKNDINSVTDVDAADDPIVQWTRGWDNNEGTGDTDLRQRTTVMGNPVHGSAVYLGPPNSLYTANDYFYSFKLAFAGREPLVFVGAGDAMMHAFKAGRDGEVDDADRGEEVFAYIPREFLDDLKTLTSQNHGETFLADGSPVIGDAYGPFPGCAAGSDCWRTVLVSGLGIGGSTVFALDVTDPIAAIGPSDKEANAARELFLWEFTDSDDSDLGLTTSEPLIGQLNDGTWAAIFGSGQGAGERALYVVDLATGALIEKVAITGGTTPGLSSPAGWVGSDGKLDAVYAGDPEGNLWKFDFTASGTDLGDVITIAFSGSSLIKVTDGGNPLPITTRPLVTPNPNGGGVIVYFGTGWRNQNLADANGMFGVFDNGFNLGTDPALDVHELEPILASGTTPNDADYQTNPNNIFRIIKTTTEAVDAVGWKVKLMDGERVLTNPTLNNGRVSFTSSDAATMDFNRNWFLGVDFVTGGTPDEPFLDINGDGLFDDVNDVFMDITDECPEEEAECPAAVDVPAVGRFLDTGVVSAAVPANIANGKDTVFITHGLESVFDEDATPGLEIFNDPGAAGGHFDHDTFQGDVEGAGNKRDHTHEYDDKYNVNGVNMLESGGNKVTTSVNTFWCENESYPATPDPSPECFLNVTGMMSADKALMDSVLELDAGVDTVVRLSILNPHSYDTDQLRDHRCSEFAPTVEWPEGTCPPEVATVAPPVTIWYQCLNGARPDNYNGTPDLVAGDPEISFEFVGPAPAFNDALLVEEQGHTCKASHIGVLVSKITNINALRVRDAGRNYCDYDLMDWIDDLDPPAWLEKFYPYPGSLAYRNDGYRGGSFTVQAADATGVVFHEDALYEHVNGASIDRDRSAASDVREILDNPGQGIGECSAFNEWQRSYKDPDYFDDGDTNTIEDPGDPVVDVSTVGTQITETIDVTRFELPEGRVSWREVLQ